MFEFSGGGFLLTAVDSWFFEEAKNGPTGASVYGSGKELLGEVPIAEFPLFLEALKDLRGEL